MRKPAFCICENKDADQLRGNREADQRLCFRYTASTISLLPKYEISSLQPSSVAVQPGLCGTWSETSKTGFLTTRLILSCSPVCLLFSGNSPLLLQHNSTSKYSSSTIICYNDFSAVIDPLQKCYSQSYCL